MIFKRALLVFAVAFVSFAGNAQEVKIGYTNIELLLVYMPEAKQMEQQLDTYQKQISEQLQAKQAHGQNRLEEYLRKKEANLLSAEEDEKWQEELQKLDAEITQFASEGEADLLAKREELLTPILEKLQKAIDDVAKEKGYTYLLNQTNSSGVSTILYGPEENDVTEDVMKKLNIKMPGE